MSRSVHNSAVELSISLFRRKRKRGNTVFSSSAGLQPFSIVGRRYSAGSSCRFSPFFSDCFERRGLVYVGSSIQHKTASDAVFAEYGFTWDAGNRITEFETVDGTAEYTYDKTGQLTGADYDYITDELYTYDDNGNRTNAGYVTGENNETLSDGTYRYSYDAEGNRTEKFLWTDTNNDGIIDASEKTLVQTYEWDYRNRLSSVTNYENGIAKEVMDYLYDYLNLMIERTVTDAATSILQSSDFNVYSNGQIVLEYDTTSSVDVVKSVNLWGANIDELVAVEQMAQSVNDNNVILWTYSDHLNSIRDVVLYDSITQTAAVVNHFIYNAFGVLVSSTDGAAVPFSISPLLNYRYTGKFFDDLTGLQNNINRWYDNTTGKWISEDPISFDGGDTNLYRYVHNQLSNCIDNNGLITFIKVTADDENGNVRLYFKTERAICKAVFYINNKKIKEIGALGTNKTYTISFNQNELKNEYNILKIVDDNGNFYEINASKEIRSFKTGGVVTGLTTDGDSGGAVIQYPSIGVEYSFSYQYLKYSIPYEGYVRNGLSVNIYPIPNENFISYDTKALVCKITLNKHDMTTIITDYNTPSVQAAGYNYISNPTQWFNENSIVYIGYILKFNGKLVVIPNIMGLFPNVGLVHRIKVQ